MAWVKVESSVSRNRKFVQAGPAASWLWICGLAYCQEGLTDGFIATEAIGFLGVKNALRLAVRLVLAHLWDVVEGGWQVHDYLQHNKPASEVRRINQERRSGGKLGGRPNLQGTHEGTLQGTLPENPSVPVAEAEAVPEATAEARIARPPGARTGLLKPPRPEAAFDGGRVWVLHKTHKDFLALRHGNEGELLAWYEQVAEDWTYGAHKDAEPGANMFKFWEARYDERWPAAPSIHPVRDTRPAWLQKARPLA